ncbi:phosphatase PAP2 family protein [Lysobacter fragariae]
MPLLVGLLLSLACFGALASLMRVDVPFSFDVPMLRLAHADAAPWLDRAFGWIASLGFAYGVIPFDIVFVIALAVRRRWREAAFVLLALGGSVWLNIELRHLFARPRPELWASLAYRDGFGFPSGHAMATMTLTWVLGLLAWRTRWRWVLVATMAAFTLLVGMSRLYLGVHYPSDVIAGWAAGAAWAVASFLLVFRDGALPWTTGRGLSRSRADRTAA